MVIILPAVDNNKRIISFFNSKASFEADSQNHCSCISYFIKLHFFCILLREIL